MNWIDSEQVIKPGQPQDFISRNMRQVHVQKDKVRFPLFDAVIGELAVQKCFDFKTNDFEGSE